MSSLVLPSMKERDSQRQREQYGSDKRCWRMVELIKVLCSSYNSFASAREAEQKPSFKGLSYENLEQKSRQYVEYCSLIIN